MSTYDIALLTTPLYLIFFVALLGVHALGEMCQQVERIADALEGKADE